MSNIKVTEEDIMRMVDRNDSVMNEFKRASKRDLLAAVVILTIVLPTAVIVVGCLLAAHLGILG